MPQVRILSLGPGAADEKSAVFVLRAKHARRGLGIFAERARWAKQRGENGAAVKICKAKREANFGNRKGRRSRRCRRFESCHSDQTSSGSEAPWRGFFFATGFESVNPTVRGTVGRSPQAHRNRYFCPAKMRPVESCHSDQGPQTKSLRFLFCNRDKVEKKRPRPLYCA